ncbi:hypothetical protein [Spirosoma aerophilum]
MKNKYIYRNISASMTPDKRLDQVEPILADVAQKTDRLIESNGQILEVATRADINAKIAAKGIIDLTIEMRQQFGQQQTQIDQLKTGMNDRFGQVDSRFNSVDNRFEQVDSRLDQLTSDQAELRQEMRNGFQEVNLKFTQFTQTQEQILRLLLDRLK